MGDRKHFPTLIRFDILAERWVVPKNVSWTVLLRLLYPVV